MNNKFFKKNEFASGISGSDLHILLKKVYYKIKIIFFIINKCAIFIKTPVIVILYPLIYINLLLKPLYKDLFFTSLTILFFLFFVPIFTYWVYANDLDNKEKIMNNNDTGIVLLDRNDKPFFTFYEVKKKTFIPISEIPLHVQLAVIAIEDREFYQHSGFSIRGIVRSIIEDIANKDLVSGGSTITQQLVKNSLLNPQKNFLRKYQEVTLAYEVEQRFSKQDILEMYLNSVYFGEGAFGIEEAAKAYFNKDAKSLSLAEASMLAAVLPAPSRLSPISGDYNQARLRQEIILDRMVHEGYISPEQKEQVLNEQLKFQKKTETINIFAPHFALTVRDELIRKYGEETVARSGFHVKTTLDLEYQKYAEDLVRAQVQDLKMSNVSNGSVVAIDPKNGEILALVGSSNWFNEQYGKVNIPTSLRQPGSAFKPIVYAAALEKGIITPATILKDVPVTYKHGSGPGSPQYKPVNYDRRFRGNVTVRRALANSLNVPSVEVLSKLGVTSALEMAQRLGISTLTEPEKYGLSLILGAAEVQLLELTQAYSVFANNGEKNDLTAILQITDKQQNTIFSHQTKPKKVLNPEYTFLISSILSDQKSRSETFGNILNISRPAAVKTGTSENYRDSLTVGYTPSLVVGVWVGNNDGASMNTVAGSLGAAPIWKKMMEQYLKNKPVEKFDPPVTIEAVRVCAQNGLPLKIQESSASGIMEYFAKGTVPKSFCNISPAKPSPPPESPSTSDKDSQIIDSSSIFHQQLSLYDGSLLNLSISGLDSGSRVKINYGR